MIKCVATSLIRQFWPCKMRRALVSLTNERGGSRKAKSDVQSELSAEAPSAATASRIACARDTELAVTAARNVGGSKSSDKELRVS